MNDLYDLKRYLPTTRKELELRGWQEVDVIIFSGDAYVDHPSFGAAVIGRVLEAEGYRVAIVPQPDWRGDHRDFLKLGRPRLFFAVTSGAMDSMVNHYTAARRLRSDDAYTPEGRAGARPDRCTATYTRILKRHFPDVPVVIGGIEASMRRLAHYDYWSDSLHPSLLIESGADMLIYGMGEKAIAEIARRGIRHDIPQTAFIAGKNEIALTDDKILLHSFETVKKDKRKYAENFAKIEIESNKLHAKTLIQPVNDLNDSQCVVVNPPYEQMTTAELDEVFNLPFCYFPHPKYKGKRIPAYEMIRFSVCMHRGCFGGCSFCTISAHQGKHITSRSKASIMSQIDKLRDLPDFKGYISDLGGPSANMYGMSGKDRAMCELCARPSCLQPSVCRNLNKDFSSLIDVYQTVDNLPYIKKSFVGSGIRYDLMQDDYGRELITRHVSGRLKVAPEHVSDAVLKLMRKPAWRDYLHFRDFFIKVNQESGLNQQLIPYFISSHPGCTDKDMKLLADETRRMHYHPEQVQDFTPTPMTLSTCMFYTGLDPYTLKPVYVARTETDKKRQNAFFFWWKSNDERKVARQRIKGKWQK